MFDLAIRNLRFRKLRALLTILAIVTPVMGAVILSGLVDLLTREMMADVNRYAGHVQVRPAMSGELTRATPTSVLNLSGEQVGRILAGAGQYDPSRTSPVVYKELEEPTYPGGPANMVLVGVQPGSEDAVIEGVGVNAGERRLAQPGDALIGPKLAAERKIGVGDRLSIGTTTLHVRGILASGSGNLRGMVVVSLADAQQLIGMGESASLVSIGYATEAQVSAAQAALRAAFPALDVVTQAEMLGSVRAMMDEQAKFFNIMTYSGLATAGIVTFLVMYLAVMERTRDIGTLRALGARRWEVVSALLTEALLLALGGGLLGCVGAPPALRAAIGTEHAMAEVWEMTLPSMGPVLLITALIALLSAAYPALRAARLDPIEALRYE